MGLGGIQISPRLENGSNQGFKQIDRSARQIGRARLRKFFHANTRRDTAKIGFDDEVLREVMKPI
jgi:hypothetical protein